MRAIPQPNLPIFTPVCRHGGLIFLEREVHRKPSLLTNVDDLGLRELLDYCTMGLV